MTDDYRVSQRHLKVRLRVRPGVVAVAIGMFACSSSLRAQSPPPLPQAQPTAGALLSADWLRDLPSAGNLFAILETAQAELVTDRFTSGGLNAGDRTRVGGFLASWSQTQFRVGDIDLTSRVDGTPLLFPELAMWEQARIVTGLAPTPVAAPGLELSLTPFSPSAAKWTALGEAFVSGDALVAAPRSSDPSPIARLQEWTHVSVVAGGPLAGPRAGLTVGGSWMRNETVERDEDAADRGRLATAHAHLVLAPNPESGVRVFTGVQSQRQGTSQWRSGHLQGTYEHQPPAGLSWRAFAGITQRTRADVTSSLDDRVVERLIDGPIDALVNDRDNSERQWVVGGRFTPETVGGRHQLQFGGDIGRVALRTPPGFSGDVAELIDGVPVRNWRYDSSDATSQRHATTATLFMEDRIALSPRLTVTAGVGFEAIDAHARGSANGIRWFTWLPAANVRWDLGTRYLLTFITGASRSANRPQLSLLAVGDPAAPRADVFRWDPVSAAAGPLVARVGPGNGGDPQFSRIDAALDRPVSDEFAIGVESRPRPHLRFSVMGLARRQSQLTALVNVGVPPSSYSTFSIRDDNADLVNSADDQDLVVFNRSPESFGHDAYQLTTDPEASASMGGIVISAQAETGRLLLLVGATAAAAVGPGNSRGFRAIENDQDVVGERQVNPNASTYARGRLFSDRAYTIKWTTIYRFARDVRLGVIARYQDGQPFSRLVIVPGMNQGTEIVQAFARGRSRFAFTGTLDVRLQKGVALGAAKMDAILDVYNLPNMRKEVEERVVTGASFRATTAIQPPRAIHLGLRVSF